MKNGLFLVAYLICTQIGIIPVSAGKTPSPPAVAEIEQKAEQGDDRSLVILGTMYAIGLIVHKDYNKTRELYEKAASNGSKFAQFNLGFLYLYLDDPLLKEDTHENKEKNIIKFLGIAQSWREKVSLQDYAKALTQFSEAARQGDALTQTLLGGMYILGHGLPQNPVKAREWFERAAEQGYAEAQTALGGMYTYGKGTQKDYKKALEWFEKAAYQGNAEAQMALGGMYEQGQGIGKNYIKARDWYEKAAAQGLITAQNALGIIYAKGHGVPQNYVKAREWFEKAAAQGDGFAQVTLGGMYEQGHGVQQDAVIAQEWFKKATDQLSKGDGPKTLLMMICDQELMRD